jgi:hypothetical protein
VKSAVSPEIAALLVFIGCLNIEGCYLSCLYLHLGGLHSNNEATRLRNENDARLMQATEICANKLRAPQLTVVAQIRLPKRDEELRSRGRCVLEVTSRGAGGCRRACRSQGTGASTVAWHRDQVGESAFA